MRHLPLSLALSAVACSGGGPAVEPPRPPPPPAPPPYAPYKTPAQFVLHPPRGGVAVSGSLRLDDGRCLVGAQNGDVFWTAKADKGCGLVAGGNGEASLPPVEAVAKLDAGRVGVVVEDGAVHVVEGGALPFVEVVPPPARLTSVVVAGERVVGLTPSGRFFELAPAGRWEARAPRLPAGHRVVDLAASGKSVLALAAPEAVLLSDDGGESFQAASASRVGAVRLARLAGGGLAALGPLGAVSWRPSGGALAAAGGVVVEASAAEAVAEPHESADFPDALAFQERRAVFVGTRWVELRDAEELAKPEETDDWFLLAGELGEPLAKRRLPRTGDCHAPRLSAAGDWVAVLCDDAAGGLFVLHGPSAGPLTRVHAAPSTGDADLAVAPNGSVLLAGACRSRSDCKSSLSLLTPQPKGSARVEPVAGEAVAFARALTFSPDGRRAFFLGAREADGKPGLFVSGDGGRSFVLKPIHGEGAESLQIGERPQLSYGEDGVLAAVVEAPRREDRGGEEHAILFFEPSGELREVSRRFPGNQYVSAFGSRVLAFHGGEPPQSALTESADGARTFDDVPFSRHLDDEDIERRHVACGWGGCVVGSTMTRVGWGAALGGGGLGARPRSAAPPSWLTPLQCELDPKAGWQTAEADRLPGPGEIALGATSWSAPYSHPAGEEARVVVARGGRLQEKPLLPRRAGAFALTGPVSSPWGWSASRVALPKGPPGGQPMRGVDVAWDHLADGTSGRATIADAGTFPATAEAPAAQLVSATGGVFAMPQGPGGLAWFVGRSASPVAYPSAPAGSVGLERTFVRGLVVGGAQLFALEPDSPVPFLAVARRDKPADPFRFSAASFGSFAQSRAAFFDVSWTVVGSGAAAAPALLVLGVAPGDASWLGLYPLTASGAFGPPEVVPTPLELGATPRACTAAERKASPRLVVRHDARLEGRAHPSFAGMRRPIVVPSILRPSVGKKPPDLIEPPVLLTTSAIYHATPSGPCLAGYAVGALPGVSGGEERVWGAVVGGDPTDSWLLRYRSPVLEAYPMKCRFKDGVAVSADVRRRIDTDAP